jgi:hypothetical protein
LCKYIGGGGGIVFSDHKIIMNHWYIMANVCKIMWLQTCEILIKLFECIICFILMIYLLLLIFQLSQGADKWISEFSSEHNQGGLNENWIDEFSKLNVTDEWAEEFSGGFGESSADPWADE